MLRMRFILAERERYRLHLRPDVRLSRGFRVKLGDRRVDPWGRFSGRYVGFKLHFERFRRVRDGSHNFRRSELCNRRGSARTLGPCGSRGLPYRGRRARTDHARTSIFHARTSAVTLAIGFLSITVSSNSRGCALPAVSRGGVSR